MTPHEAIHQQLAFVTNEIALRNQDIYRLEARRSELQNALAFVTQHPQEAARMLASLGIVL